ncbi:hypothetical protein K456DRAFT_54068 [Colletotrichum gloeosporioides 23]|nr:hypothetical protein K456DRAFT_54068 [Colletotrichum gloeosporioides 23]
MDSPEGSANDAMTAEINCRVNEAVNISIPEAGGANWPSQAKITLLEGALSVKLKKALISYIAIWCPRLKHSYLMKAKKVKKVKKAVRPKESSSSTIEELRSSEIEESLGKE